jgi:hypothetical protein
MSTTLPLEQMTTEEKLRIMEEIWADLARNEAAFESPAWHEAVLKERRRRRKSGEDILIDWETDKKQLRDRLT